jgi:hypothetical protein
MNRRPSAPFQGGPHAYPDLDEPDKPKCVLFGKDAALPIQIANPSLGDTAQSPFGSLKFLLDGFEYRPSSA